jgi:hypothetical protein
MTTCKQAHKATKKKTGKHKRTYQLSGGAALSLRSTVIQIIDYLMGDGLA